MVGVCVGGSSDTLADVVHRERKQEVRLHLAGLESGLLRREGQVRLPHGEVAHRCYPWRVHLGFGMPRFLWASPATVSYLRARHE